MATLACMILVWIGPSYIDVSAVAAPGRLLPEEIDCDKMAQGLDM